MVPTKVTATELRLKTRELVERVKYKGEHVVIENFGRPMVVMISFEDYQRLMERIANETTPLGANERPSQAD